MSDLLLLVTLVAACFGLGTVSPTIAIALGALAMPAWCRTVTILTQREGDESNLAAGKPTRYPLPSPRWRRMSTFFDSLGVVATITAMSLLAFFPPVVLAFLTARLLWSLGAGGGIAVVIVVWGLVAGALLGYASARWTTRRLW